MSRYFCRCMISLLLIILSVSFLFTSCAEEEPEKVYTFTDDPNANSALLSENEVMDGDSHEACNTEPEENAIKIRKRNQFAQDDAPSAVYLTEAESDTLLALLRDRKSDFTACKAGDASPSGYDFIWLDSKGELCSVSVFSDALFITGCDIENGNYQCLLSLEEHEMLMTIIADCLGEDTADSDPEDSSVSLENGDTVTGKFSSGREKGDYYSTGTRIKVRKELLEINNAPVAAFLNAGEVNLVTDILKAHRDDFLFCGCTSESMGGYTFFWYDPAYASVGGGRSFVWLLDGRVEVCFEGSGIVSCELTDAENSMLTFLAESALLP